MANLSNINNKFLVTTGGNVGIGDTGPSTKLTVDVPAVLNNTVNLFKLGDDTNGLVFKKFWDSGGIAWRLNKGISGINMMTFSQDGKVGIGTDSPDNILHIRNGDTTYASQVGADTMLFLETTNVSNALQFTSANTAQQYIMFGDDDPNVGWISYNHSDNNLNFRVNAIERMRIDSSGNVTIGTGIIKPAIGGDIAITQGAIGLRINDAASAISPTTATSNNDNAVDLGVSNIRFRNLYMGGTGTFAGNVTVGANTVQNGTNPGLKIQSTNTSQTVLGLHNTTSRNWEVAVGGSTNTLGAGKFYVYDNTADAGRLVIDTSGNVGIGTISPAQKLHVIGNIYSVNSGTDGGQIRLANSGGGSNWYWAARTTGLNLGELGAADGRMFIANGGNVGIGTTSPSQKLEVSGNTYVTGYVQASSALIGLKNGYATFGSNSTATGIALSRDFLPSSYPDLIINSSGNVGIGTSSPSQKLEVTGNFKLNGTVVQEGTGNNLTFKYRTANSNAYSGGNATCKFGRFYWTPAHWVTGAPVIKVTLHCKYYQGERREYIIKAGYQNTDPVINELQPSSPQQKITLSVGATTSAGYNYAGQPVYYVDLQWTQTAYIWGWAQVESQVGFLTSNPTSTWGGVVMDSAITQTNNSGTTKDYTSFFAGNVGVGTETPPAKLSVYAGGADGIQLLDLSDTNNSGRVFYARSGGGSWCIMNNATNYSIRSGGVPGSTSGTEKIRLTGYSATSWTSGSDETIKENIKPIGNVLNKINDYRCVEYNLIDDETKDKKIGFIAQDWQEDFPQIIEQMENEKIGMKYTETIPILLKAIQELKAEIELLKSK